MIEVRGLAGESLTYDGEVVAKWRHHGKEESARNPVSTFRDGRVERRTNWRGKPVEPAVYDVTIACSTIFVLAVDDANRAAAEELVAALRSDATRRQ